MIRNISRKGVWLIDEKTLSILWAGEKPTPKLSFLLRLRLAADYIRSSGHVSEIIPAIKLWIKAVAFCLNSSQVSSSENPYETACLKGSTAEEAWSNFNLTSCVPPHLGHGKDDILDAMSSRPF